MKIFFKSALFYYLLINLLTVGDALAGESNLKVGAKITLSKSKVLAGEKIDVTVRVLNDGNDETKNRVNGSPTSHYLYIYISPHPGNLRGSRHIASVRVVSLKAGSHLDMRVNVKIPADWPKGQAYIHALVDATNYVRNESDEMDNYSYNYGYSASLQVDFKRSNLKTAGKLTASKTKDLREGETITVQVPIENSGLEQTLNGLGGNPTSFYVDLYLSPDPGDLRRGVSLKRISTPPLGPQSQRVLSFTVTIPNNWWDGKSYIHALVDSYRNTVRNELYDRDNYSYSYGHSLEVTIKKVRSNLKTAAKLQPSATSVKAGQKITVKVPVINAGDDVTRNGLSGSPSDFYVYLYLSPFPGSLDGSVNVGWIKTNSLTAGQRTDLTITASIPGNLRRGSYWLHAVVDAYRNYIRNESDDRDNYSYTYGHSVQLEVDLARSNLKTASKIVPSVKNPSPGQALSFTLDIENNGNTETLNNVGGNPQNFYVDFYISRYPFRTDGAAHLGRIQTNSLAAGQSRKITFFGRIPSNWPKGRSYVHALVDGYGNYIRNESNERDNYSYYYGHSAALDIGNSNEEILNKWSDLRSETPLTPSETVLKPGQNFTIKLPIKNFGGAETYNSTSLPVSFAVHFFISKEADTLDGAVKIGETTLPSLGPNSGKLAVALAKIPLNWVSGKSYIHAQIDPNGYVKNERDTSDNYTFKVSHSAVITVIHPLSNLTFGSSVSPCKATAAVGETICAEIELFNTGGAPTQSELAGNKSDFTVSLYISQHPNSLVNASKISDLRVSSLGPKERKLIKIFGKIPTTWPAGPSYLHAIVDSRNEIKNESNEGDNTTVFSSQGGKIQIERNYSNLKTASAIRVNGSSFKLGQQVKADVTVENTGLVETLSAFGGQPVRFRVSFFLSQRKDLLERAVPVGSRYVDSVPAGGSVTFTHVFNIPGTLPPGQTYLHAVVDSQDEVKNESNEGDNSTVITGHWAQFNVVREYSDLVSQSQLTVSSLSPHQGDMVRLSLRVQNTGAAPTLSQLGGSPQSFRVDFYISKRPKSILGARLLGYVYLPALQPQQVQQAEISVQIPTNYPPGQAYIHALVDGTDSIRNESEEGNNLTYFKGHSRSINVVARSSSPTNGLSNLQTRGTITLSKTVAVQGEKIFVTVPIQNSGSFITANRVKGSPQSFYTNVYITKQANSLSGAHSLGRVLVPPLRAGQSADLSFQVTIPSWPAGQYYIHAFVDSYRNYVRNETKEDDNISYQLNHSTTIRIEPIRSNLKTASSITLNKKKVFEGEYLQVKIPIENSGQDWTRYGVGGNLQGFYVDVYISRYPSSLQGSRQLVRLNTPALGPNSSRLLVTTVKIPDGWPRGTSYIHAYLDSYRNNVRNESDENDNYSFTYKHSAPIEILNKRSNLQTGGKVQPEISVATDNQEFNVTFSVINTGNERTLTGVGGRPTGFYSSIYISKTPDLTGASLLARPSFPVLAPGQKVTKTVRVRIPANWPVGKSYLHVFVDSYRDHVRNESSERDNYSFSFGHSAEIQIIRKRSNLKTYASLILSHKNRNDGDYINITVPVENSGVDITRNGVAGNPTSFYVAVYLAPRPGDLSGARLLARKQVPPLPAGQKTDVQFYVQIPVGTIPSKWYIHAMVDEYQNYVRNETDDGDNYSYSYNHSAILNTGQIRSNLQTAAQLQSNNSTYSPGGAVSVKIFYTNAGNAPTLNGVAGSPTKFYVDLYLSNHPSSIRNAYQIGRKQVDSLPPKGQGTVTITGNIPIRWPGGTAYFHAVIDSYGNYVRNESDEGDNYSYSYGHSKQITITGGGATPKWSNLVGGGKIQSDKQVLQEGETFTLSFTVKNVGQEVTKTSQKGGKTNFRVRFYIAPNSDNLMGARSLGETTLYALDPGKSEVAHLNAVLPVGWPGGPSYIHAIIDSSNQVGNESDKQDNRSFYTNHSLKISVKFSASNLRFAKKLKVSPPTASPGDTVNVEIAVTNDGDDTTKNKFGGTSISFHVRLYISDDPKSIAGAGKLADVQFSPLGAKGTDTAIVSVKIPANFRGKTAYIHGVVDVNNWVQNESNEGDNRSWQTGHSASIQLTQRSADLKTAKTIGLSSKVMRRNQQYSATVFLTNAGNDQTRNSSGLPTKFFVDLYIGPFSNGLKNAVKLGSAELDPLAAGANTSTTIFFKLPANWNTGTSYIHAIVDARNSVANEANRGNNSSFILSHSVPVDVKEGYSNLRTKEKITASNTSPSAGEYIYVTVKVTNSGTETTKNSNNQDTTSRIALYLGQWKGSSGAVRLGEASLPVLGPGSDKIVQFFVRIPPNWPKGNSYLHAFVDSQRQVTNESDEGDNWSYQINHSLQLNVGEPAPPPNTNASSNLRTGKKLSVDNPTPGEGEELTVTVDIWNSGKGTTAYQIGGSPRGFQVYLYLAKSPAAIAGAVLLGSKSFSPLAGGKHYIAPFTVKIPANWQGKNYIHAFIDSRNDVRNESDEQDNYSFSLNHSVQIDIKPKRSNLRIAQKLIADKSAAAAGESVSVIVKIANTGNDVTRNSVGGSPTGFYLSLYLAPTPYSLSGASLLQRVSLPSLGPKKEYSHLFRITIPASWRTGKSYFHAFVDEYRDYVRNESSENDNRSYQTGHSISIQIGQKRSNLRTAAKLQLDKSTVSDNGAFIVTVPVVNTGNDYTRNGISGALSGFYIDIYMGSSPTDRTGWRYLGRTGSIPALAPKERRDIRIPLRLPANIKVGTYYIHAAIDAYQNYVRNETDENDNYSYYTNHSAQIKVVKLRSNLRTYANIYVSNSSPNGGAEIEINVPIQNTGNRETLNGIEGSPTSFYTDIYLTQNPTTTSGAINLGRLRINSLKPGQKTIAQFLTRIPTNIRAGRYYLHAVIDGYGNNVRNESDENDNYSYYYGHSAILYINQPRSNLRTAELLSSSKTDLKSGETVKVTIPIVNAGSDGTKTSPTGSPTGFTVELYIGPNSDSLAGAQKVATYTEANSLAAQKRIYPAVSFTVPSGLSGDYWLHARIDSQNNVGNESDKNDNYSYKVGHSLRVSVNKLRSDLTTDKKLSPSNPAPQEGESFDVTVSVKNEGSDETRDKFNGTPVKFDVWVYISSSPYSLAGGTVVGKATSGGPLKSGATTSVKVSITLPAGWTGQKYLHAVLNPPVNGKRKVGNERDFSDNFSGVKGHSAEINIGSKRADLKFASAIKPAASQLSPGGNSSLTVEIKNAGNDTTRDKPGGTPQPVEVEFFFSYSPQSRANGISLGKVITAGPLAAGGKETLNLTFKVPQTNAKFAYLHAYIKPAGNESYTFDNESYRTGHSVQVQLLNIAMADLGFAGKIRPSTSAPYQGQSLDVEITVVNNGTTTTKDATNGKPTDFWVEVYLAPNPADLKNSTLFGKAKVQALPGGQQTTVKVNGTIPGNYQTGKTYLHAVIDPAKQVKNESNPADNVSYANNFSAVINISSSANKLRSDVQFDGKLQVSSNSPYLGQIINVGIALYNGGNDETKDTVGGQATGFKVNLYLDKSTTKSAGAVKVGSATASSLKSQDRVRIQTAVNIPTTLSPGKYYLHAEIDPDFSIGNEGDRTNNYSWKTGNSVAIDIVKGKNHADLQIKGQLSASTTSPYPGQQLTVKFQLTNAGNDTTRDKVSGKPTGFTVELYISQNKDATGSLTKLGQFKVTSPLKSGDTIPIAVAGTIPSGWNPGPAYLHIVVDAQNDVGNELNRKDNASYNTGQSIKIDVSQKTSNKRSNLRLVSTISVQGQPYAGGWVTVEFKVENSGNDTTRDKINGKKVGFSVILYLSDKSNSIANAAQWQSFNLNALDPNQTHNVKKKLRIPPNTQPGTYYAIAEIDGLGDVGNESDRFDNLDFKKAATLNIQGIRDGDGDGYKSDVDCDDSDRAVYPKAKEVCDGKDNDCDGNIDVGTNLCPKNQLCVNGSCQGQCDPPCASGFKCYQKQCVEDSCYTLGCPQGKICQNGQCIADPCSNVTCKAGQYCKDGKCIDSCAGVQCQKDEVCREGSCIKDPCAGVQCPFGYYCSQGTCKADPCTKKVCGAGRVCDPATGQCKDDPCANVTCPSPDQVCIGGSCYKDPCNKRCKKDETCKNGYCIPNNCYYKGCPQDQLCVEGRCVQDPCANVTCKPGEFCRKGKCYKSCFGVTCPSGEICVDGQCKPDPCANKTCPKDEICQNGQCIADKCKGVYCQKGQVCDPASGQCKDDPCNWVSCPSGQECRNGVCYTSQCKQTCAAGKVCKNGQCVDDNCYINGCPENYLCVAGTCVKDPCLNVQCDSTSYCYRGNCIKSCAEVSCPSGEICVRGTCQKDPCDGVSCNTGEVCIDGKCQKDPCDGVSCPSGQVCHPSTGACIDDPCDGVTCPSQAQYCDMGTCRAYKCPKDCPTGFVCYKGACVEDNCYSYGCPKGKICQNGQCTADPCDGISCPDGEFCRNGRCVQSCAGVKCQKGEICIDGNCQKDLCDGVKCQKGEICIDGNCQKDLCDGKVCGAGRVCDPATGQCKDDPCNGVTCPSGQVCRNGNCYASECSPPCKDGYTCENKTCVEDNCYTRGCPKGQICYKGMCSADLCEGEVCPDGKICRFGICVPTCAGITCADDEICTDGKCQKDLCKNKSCPSGKVCIDGSCQDDLCKGKKCGKGRICDQKTGQCIDDPCRFVSCPKGQFCRNGNCYLPDSAETPEGETSGEVPGESTGELPTEGAELPEGSEPVEGSDLEGIEKGDDAGQSSEKAVGEVANTAEKSSADGSGTADEIEPDGAGCGCQNSAPLQTVWLLILGLFGLFTRRRRQ